LKIKLDQYEIDQNLLGVDMLRLNDCLSDPTKAKQILACDLMSEFARLRALCADDPVNDPPAAQKAVDATIRFIEKRRREVEAELDAPAVVWPERGASDRTPPSPRPPMLVEGGLLC
jgi:hypothetical protein